MRYFLVFFLVAAVTLLENSDGAFTAADAIKNAISTANTPGVTRTDSENNFSKRYLRIDGAEDEERGVSSTIFNKMTEKLKATDVAQKLAKLSEKAKKTTIGTKLSELRKKMKFSLWYTKKMSPDDVKAHLKLDVPGAAVNTKKNELLLQYEIFYKVSKRAEAKKSV